MRQSLKIGILIACGAMFAAGSACAQVLSFAPQAERPKNIIEMIFGRPKAASAPSRDFTPPAPPINLSTSPAPAPQSQPKKIATGGSSQRTYGGGGSQAICVRTCDGFFFPVNYEGARGSDRYQEACQSSCPNAETEVYFMPPGADLDRAANAKGRNYTALANAFKYRQQRDETCSCKTADQNWAQVLAPAEQLVRQNKNDVVVTQERSEQSARPQAPAASAAKPAKDKLASAAAVIPAAE